MLKRKLKNKKKINDSLFFGCLKKLSNHKSSNCNSFHFMHFVGSYLIYKHTKFKYYQ